MSTAINPLTAISTWSIDPAHSSVQFKVRHMMISNVRGEFRTVRGDLKLNEADITQSEIDIEIDTSSIHTRDEQRDAHLRSPDFLDTERHPRLTFRSTKLEKAGVVALRVQGDLTHSRCHPQCRTRRRQHLLWNGPARLRPFVLRAAASFSPIENRRAPSVEGHHCLSAVPVSDVRTWKELRIRSPCSEIRGV